MLDRRAFLAASAAAVAAPALAATPAPIIDDAIWINERLASEGFLRLPPATYTLRSPIQIIGSKLVADKGCTFVVGNDFPEGEHIVNAFNFGRFFSQSLQIIPE